MKAILLEGFGGSENMSFTEVDRPTCGEDQVLIQVAATSVNRPDIVQRQGNYAPPKGESPILGLEVAGQVIETGSGVSRWQIGDRVLALIGGGGYAEIAVAHADHVMSVPDRLSDFEAACICETYITAYLNLFLLGGLIDGEQVLLHGGGGGVNTAAIQICSQLAPSSALYVTASSGKTDRVRDLGVHHVIDYTTDSFLQVIKEQTNNAGVDVILDHIGAKYLGDNMKSLSVGGRLLLIGVTSGIKAELNLALMMVKRQQIIGSVLRSRSIQEKAEIIQQFERNVLPSFADGSITPLVHQILPLSDAAAAHELMESSGHFGKIVLAV